jgi:hypothetical protein
VQSPSGKYRDDGAGKSDPRANAGEDDAADASSYCHRDCAQYGRRSDHHQDPARYSGAEAPEDKPRESERPGTRYETRDYCQHRHSDCKRNSESASEQAGRRGSSHVASEIEGAKIVGLPGGEPSASDEERNERGVSEPSQADADQQSTEASGRGEQGVTVGGEASLIGVRSVRQHWTCFCFERLESILAGGE